MKGNVLEIDKIIYRLSKEITESEFNNPLLLGIPRRGDLIAKRISKNLDQLNGNDKVQIYEVSNLTEHLSYIEKKNIIQAIKYLGKFIGVFSNGIAATLKKEEKLFNEEEINLLIKKRNEARKNKDFDLADNIRKELIEMGIEIKDQSNETIWKKV